jgi:hypothetical protein
MLVVWIIGRNLDVNWQTGTAVTLMSFFMGFVEWYFAGYILTRSPNLIGRILNLDIFTISGPEVLIVTGLALGSGIVGGLLVLLLNGSKDSLEDSLGMHTRGYVDNNEKVWKSLLRSAFENAVRQHGGGWVPVVSLATTDDVSYQGAGDKPGVGGAHPTPEKPHVTVVETKTKTDTTGDTKEQKGQVAKELPTITTTVEEKHETTETKSETTDRAPPSPPKVWHVAGLLYSFDAKDPFELVIGPQYEVELKPGSRSFLEISKMIKWDQGSLKDAHKWDRAKRDSWEKEACKFRYPRNLPIRMTKLLTRAGEPESARPVIRLVTDSEKSRCPEKKRVPEEKPKMLAEAVGLPDAGLPPAEGEDSPSKYVGAEKWIKHPEVLALDVFPPKPLYVFLLAKGKDAPN